MIAQSLPGPRRGDAATTMHVWVLLFSLVLSSLVFDAPVARAQESAADSVPRTYRIRAGSGRAVLENGERVIVLEGGVHLESQGATVESKRAREYRTREHVFFYENVRIIDREVEMTGDEGEFLRPANRAELRGRVRIRDARGEIHSQRARYDRSGRILWLWGDVDFRDEKTRVRADSVVYRQETGLGEAFGRVVFTDQESGSEAVGTHGFYDRNTGETWLDPEPVMVLRGSGVEDTEVRADELRYDRDRGVVRARGRVQIERGPTRARADSAILYDQEERIELRGRPELLRSNTRLRGRRIDIHYRGDEIDRVEVQRDARLVQTRSDTLLIPDHNELEGDDAVLYFDEGVLRRAVVSGRARSLFVPEERDEGRISLNEAHADSIIVLFGDEETEEVIFLGNASGVYRFYEGDLAALARPREAHYDTVFGVVRGDTTRFDFRQEAEIVHYRAERILYLVSQNDLHLQQAAEVRYEGRTLSAGRIHYDADTDVLDAKERPLLVETGDRMYGDRMGYHMDTGHAWIQQGSTQYDQGYYTGDLIRKTEEGVLQVTNATYTTCDLAEPHYRFVSDRMKIYLHEKVVGRPVRLYLGNVPFGFLPFIVNSVKTDRHSGFLQPDVEFGVGTRSRYIRGLDYYWAASTYFDFLFSSEYNERTRPDRTSVQDVLETPDTRGLRFSVRNRYKVRYHVDGNIQFDYLRRFGADLTAYTLRGSHDQTIGEQIRLTGNLDYQSQDRAIQLANENVDFERSRVRQITSALTLRRSRSGNLVNVTANLRRVQRLAPEEDFTGVLITRTIPNLNLAFRSIRLAPGNPSTMGPVRRFLHSLQLAPRLNLTRTTSDVRVGTLVHSQTGEPIAPGDTTVADSLVETRFDVEKTELLTASTGASLSRQTRLWIFNLTPSVSYSELFRRSRPVPENKRHSRTLSTGLAASTTFYGLFHPDRLGVTAIRHRLEPRASLAYRPEIRGQQTRSQTLGLSLQNQIDVKYEKDGEERRLDGVFSWSLSTSYNPTVLGGPGEPDRKFSNIQSAMTINRQGPLRIDISQVYDPYRGRIVSTRIPFAMRFNGSFGYGDVGQEVARRNRVVEEEGRQDAPEDTLVTEPKKETLEDVEPVRVGSGGPLQWNAGLHYSLIRELGQTRSARVGVGFSIQPTRKWNVTYNASYDATARALVNPSIRITRDLHCWKASFSRVEAGGDWRYYFRIYVDRHQEDLFYESGDRSYRY